MPNWNKVIYNNKNNNNSMRSEREWQKYNPLSSPLSKDKGLRGIGHSMSIGNLTLSVTSVTVSYLIHYESLFQNATDIITKCDSYFITKYDYYKLLQITTVTHCDDFITKCDSYYKLWQFYNKMRQLLQNATFITNCDNTHVYKKIHTQLKGRVEHKLGINQPTFTCSK